MSTQMNEGLMARSLGGRNTKINIRHLKQPTLVKHALNIWCVLKKILTDCYIFVFHDKVTKIRVYLTRRPRSHCGGCWQTLCHYKVAGWEWWWQWWWPSLTIIIIKVAGHRVGSSKKSPLCDLIDRVKTLSLWSWEVFWIVLVRWSAQKPK